MCLIWMLLQKRLVGREALHQANVAAQRHRCACMQTLMPKGTQIQVKTLHKMTLKTSSICPYRQGHPTCRLPRLSCVPGRDVSCD